jgi:hypothetical protein
MKFVKNARQCRAFFFLLSFCHCLAVVLQLSCHASCDVRDFSDPVFLLAALLSHLKLNVHCCELFRSTINELFRSTVKMGQRLVLNGEIRQRVTLKKNLEKRRVANHLSP